MSSKLPTTRLTADERRKEIIRAALKVFAKSGFHGTTTKALAEAAGVSEALLFRHFPSKDELYAALQADCGEMKSTEESEKVWNLEPSTSSLVIMMHYFVAKMLSSNPETDEIGHGLHRMMVHSFMEDGHFARQFMQHVEDDLIAKMEACLKAAAKAGDLVDSPLRMNLRAWFGEHFVAMLMLNQLPGKPIVDFKVPPATQIEQATWFALLGMGLKHDVIRRHYNPKAFAMLSS